MTKKSLKILFFGSGPVAAESLRLLLNDSAFEVEAVITKPAPPHHRGSVPVAELCTEHGVTYHTPANKAELTKFFATAKFESPVGIVIDYGIIIDQAVIDYFPHGIVNSHFSLLPEWRGADPITFSLLSGQKATGVSLMSIVQAMDEGPLLTQNQLIIQPTDTSQTLTEKLIDLSHQMLQTHIASYAAGTLKVSSQTGTPTYSRKLTKNDGLIDWNKPADVLEREVRAFHEWPKSQAVIGNHTVIIRECDVVTTSGVAGFYEATKKELIVFCGTDALRITKLQPVNKKEMPVQAFLAGYSL